MVGMDVMHWVSLARTSIQHRDRAAAAAAAGDKSGSRNSTIASVQTFSAPGTLPPVYQLSTKLSQSRSTQTVPYSVVIPA